MKSNLSVLDLFLLSLIGVAGLLFIASLVLSATYDYRSKASCVKAYDGEFHSEANMVWTDGECKLTQVTVFDHDCKAVEKIYVTNRECKSFIK